MLRHPTIEKLQQLKLPAIARELTERSNRRLALKLRQAKLRHSATLEDLDTARSARFGQGAHRRARHLSVDRRAFELPHQRPHRDRQDLAGVCAGPSSCTAR